MATKTSANPPTQIPDDNVDEQPRYIPEKTLFEWHAPSRPFKKRSRDYWVVIMSVAGLLAFILFLAEGVMPVLMIVSLVFLYFVLSNVPPHEVLYKITNIGVKVEDSRTEWDLLTRYWFDRRLDTDLLVAESVLFPGKLELVVLSKDAPKIKEIMTKYLPEDKPKETAVDKVTDWVANKLPQK